MGDFSVIDLFLQASLIVQLVMILLLMVSIISWIVIFEANPDIEIVFQSDKNVVFDSVAKAMAAVQSVGITKIGIVTTGYAN